MDVEQVSHHGTEQLVEVLNQWVTFGLDGERYGIDVMQVQEVLRYTEVTLVPGAPHYVLGIINLRGNVVTVIDTRTRLGIPKHDITEATRIIVVDIEEQTIGLLVDKVSEVVYTKASEVTPSPSLKNDEGSKYIQGVAHLETGLLILMDLDKLIANK